MENLNKLTRLLGADRLITAEDVQQILLGIMEILKTYKQGTESINEETKQVVNSLLEQTIKYNQETISDFKSEADKAHAERMKELQTFLSEVKTTLGDMEVMMGEVKDGKDADEERVVEEVINRIKIDPTVVTMSAEEVRDKIASLKDEDRLDKSAIKGLEKVLQQKDLDYAVATLQHQASFLINKGGLKTVSHDATLSGDGTPESPLRVESTSGLTLETDGTPNGSQTLLNLVAGTNVTLTDNGTGSVTIDATGGSGSPGGSTTQLQYNNAGAFGGISGATTNGTAVTYTTGNLIGADVKASGSGGLALKSNNGTTTSLHGAGGGANNTFYGDVKLDYATATTVPYIDASKNLISSAVTPTELDYLSGVTSAIQTQLDAKEPTITTLAVNKGGTGQTTYINGQLLIGNTTGNTLTKATLTGTSNQVVVTNGGGSITLSTPQDIGTSSNPQFASVKAGYIADTNGNEEVIFTTTASAVNEITVANAATGNNPNITASGSDSNIGLDLTSKGTGSVNIKGNSTQAGQLRIYEDTDDGSNYTAFKVGTQSGNVTYTLPTADGSSGQLLSTNGSGVLSWATGGGGGSFVGCRVYKSGSQSIGTTLTAVNFDAESFDTDTMHDNVTNNTRITFTTAGKYIIGGYGASDVNGIGRTTFRLNGSTTIAAIGVGNAGTSTQNGAINTTIYDFSAGDYVEMLVAFGASNACLLGAGGTQFWAYKID